VSVQCSSTPHGKLWFTNSRNSKDADLLRMAQNMEVADVLNRTLRSFTVDVNNRVAIKLFGGDLRAGASCGEACTPQCYCRIAQEVLEIFTAKTKEKLN